MSEQTLTILKLCLLAVVYLFFLRVLRAVWAEVSDKPRKAKRRDRAAARSGAVPRAAAPVAPPPPAVAPRKKRSTRKSPTELVVVEPVDQKGRRYPLGDEITVGRAAGCQVTVDDTYVSQLHARVFMREAQVYVEDLGSTNGTYLNRSKVAGPMMMQRGDQLQVGNTVLEVS